MANTIIVKRGSGTVPKLAAGELGYSTSLKKLYIGNASGGNTEIGPGGGLYMPYIAKLTNSTKYYSDSSGKMQFVIVGTGTLKLGSSTTDFKTSLTNPRTLYLSWAGGTTTGKTAFTYRAGCWSESDHTGTAYGFYPGVPGIYFQVPAGMVVYRLT